MERPNLHDDGYVYSLDPQEKWDNASYSGYPGS
jgi:hypothetical protein